jgi:hypothetical protein
MGGLSDLEREKIVGACLAGTSVTKTATLLGVLATIHRVMLAHTNHGKTTSAKRNSGRKSAWRKRDRRALRKIAQLPQHRWQDSRTEYIS